MRIREEWNHTSSRLRVRWDEGGVDVYNQGSGSNWEAREGVLEQCHLSRDLQEKRPGG